MEYEASTITGISLGLTLGLAGLLLSLPRRYAILPMLVAGCYMSLAQALSVAGLSFNVIRILIFFGVIRIVLKGELASIRLNAIDKTLIASVMASAFLHVVLSGDTSNFTGRLAIVYDAFGIYFIARAVLRDMDDIILTVKMLALLMIPLAALFVLEHVTGRNLFSLLGGVDLFSEVRNGRVRAQGPFKHSILAGTFGATMLPLLVGLRAYSTQGRLLATGGVLAAGVIIVTSASSGPLLAALATVMGLFCWSVRSSMRAIRWGIVVFFVALHIYMNDPVWFLIARLGDVFGGGGWYRSALINAAIVHFNEWWLSGTTYTRHWMASGISANPNMADIVNHFVAQAVSGGLLALVLFIWLIVRCFKVTGSEVRDETRWGASQRFFIWCMGCAMLGHVVSFFAVSYFDQMTLFWYVLIATIAVLEPGKKGRTIESEEWHNQSTVQFST